MATPAPVGTIVDQAGDIDARASTSVLGLGDSQTVVKTRARSRLAATYRLG